MEQPSSGVPTPAPRELRRERLLDSLHKHRGRPLILLVAPAGFGKSTLAAAYARESGAAVAWLTLQSADRDAQRLFRRLADALEAAFEEPNCLPELRRGLAHGADGVGLARLLLEDLGQAPSGFKIVLDDFQNVGDSEDVAASVDALIRELPESGQIVMTARDAPALSMTRLVVEGAVFPLGTDDLRFSPSETRALRELHGGDASRDEQAEGWVAGILLGGAPRQLNIGGGSLLGTYVEREVLDRLSATEQGWLEMLSVFDVMTVRAAEKTLGPGPWKWRLLDLAERLPFLAAGEDGTYRLHALVRETVLNRLRRSPDDRWTQAWTALRDLAEEADDLATVVRACQELGQMEVAVALVSRAAADGIRQGRWPAVMVNLELLPRAIRRANPQLCLQEARALVSTGHTEQAHEVAEAALHHGGRSGDVEVQVSAIIELATAAYASDLAAADDWLAAGEQILLNSVLSPDRRKFLEGRLLGVRGICYTLAGKAAEARAAFESGERLLKLRGASRDLAVLQHNFGSFCNRTGDYATAQHALAAAASQWRVMGDRGGLAGSQIVLGDLQLRLGKLEAAGAALNDSLDAARDVGHLRFEAYAAVSLGQWHRACGRIADAVAALDRAAQLIEEIVERELLATVLVHRAETALLQDDQAKARECLARGQAEAQRIGSSEALAAVNRALGRLHLLDGSTASALSHLDKALELARQIGSPDEQAQTLYWLGTAHLALNHTHEARGCLEEALDLVERAELPALLAGPVAENPGLLHHGRGLGIRVPVLAEIERLAAPRQPWTGVTVQKPSVRLAAETDLPRVEIQLFGSFTLHRDGKLVSRKARVDRARELAALLVLNPKGISDDAVAELMFPDFHSREGALHNLYQAVYALRKDIGKPSVQYGAKIYQLNPQLELIADVRDFNDALARARGATGDALIQALSRAVELYRGPLLADAGWAWLEPVRMDYRDRYISAALQLADAVASLDVTRSSGIAEAVLAEAPETDLAYERLIRNAQLQGDSSGLRRLVKRYEAASAQYGFPMNPYLLNDDGSSGGRRAAH